MNTEIASIAARLKAELDEASREELAAREDCGAVMNGPNGLPQPDGIHRIRQASARMNTALDKHLRALKRYLDFTKHGIRPED